MEPPSEKKGKEKGIEYHLRAVHVLLVVFIQICFVCLFVDFFSSFDLLTMDGFLLYFVFKLCAFFFFFFLQTRIFASGLCWFPCRSLPVDFLLTVRFLFFFFSFGYT